MLLLSMMLTNCAYIKSILTSTVYLQSENGSCGSCSVNPLQSLGELVVFPLNVRVLNPLSRQEWRIKSLRSSSLLQRHGRLILSSLCFTVCVIRQHCCRAHNMSIWVLLTFFNHSRSSVLHSALHFSLRVCVRACVRMCACVRVCVCVCVCVCV